MVDNRLYDDDLFDDDRYNSPLQGNSGEKEDEDIRLIPKSSILVSSKYKPVLDKG